MFAYTRLTTADGASHVLVPGDLIGRLDSAALHLDDVRVSEAHALVSLRGRELQLLALRGVVAVDGKPTRQVALRAGLRVHFAPGLEVLVDEVALPDHVLGLEGPGLPRQVLSGANSLRLRPRPSLEGRYRADADAWIHGVGGGWRLTAPGQPPRGLGAGDTFELGGARFSVVRVPLSDASSPETWAEGGLQAPLTVVARFDTVHIHQGGALRLALDGLAARIVSELVAFDGPVAWHVVAGEVWPEFESRTLLRRRWDIALVRLRRKLRAAHVRADLIRSGGNGTIELLLHEGDRVDDQT